MLTLVFYVFGLIFVQGASTHLTFERLPRGSCFSGGVEDQSHGAINWVAHPSGA